MDVGVARLPRRILCGGKRLVGNVHGVTLNKDAKLRHAPFQASLTTAQAETLC